ncbi:MAG: hypothetical protein ACYS47_07210 [Planctomycetota bacterium]
MLRDGLFSSKAFLEAASGFVLLRLKPGPAESLFGITAAPMAAVADWHGRVVVANLNLRGDITGACTRLKAALRNFDRKKASRPPTPVPPWARDMVKPGGEKTISTFLERVHPRRGGKARSGPSFRDLAKVYRGLEREGEIVAFCTNAFEALEGRTPAEGREYKGYADEVALLEEMAYCRNDRMKFGAIRAFGAFAPVGKIGFFATRAGKKSENCRNPNVVLCNCLTGIGLMAGRYGGVKNRRSALDHREILKVLPFMIEVLDTEGRNNGACRCARGSLETIVRTTGAPEALGAYLHNLKAPKCDSDWMRTMTDKYHAKALAWLQEATGFAFDADFDAWAKWYAACRNRLVYHAGSKRFVLDGRAAKAYRAKLARALRGR